jgi:hypothetical protein
MRSLQLVVTMESTEYLPSLSSKAPRSCTSDSSNRCAFSTQRRFGPPDATSFLPFQTLRPIPKSLTFPSLKTLSKNSMTLKNPDQRKSHKRGRCWCRSMTTTTTTMMRQNTAVCSEAGRSKRSESLMALSSHSEALRSRCSCSSKLADINDDGFLVAVVVDFDLGHTTGTD